MATPGKPWVKAIAAVLIFLAGAGVGFWFGRGHRRFPGTALRAGPALFGPAKGLQTITVQTAGGSMVISRDAGNISQIQNGSITIVDDAGQRQNIQTSGSTVIISAKGKLSLGDLKTGEWISAVGNVDASNNFTATNIAVRE